MKHQTLENEGQDNMHFEQSHRLASIAIFILVPKAYRCGEFPRIYGQATSVFLLHRDGAHLAAASSVCLSITDEFANYHISIHPPLMNALQIAAADLIFFL